MDTRDELYLSNYWWVLTVRGIAAILFGVAAVFWPGITLVTLVYLFSAFILVYGIVDIIHGLSGHGGGTANRVLTLLLGALEVGLGVYLIRHTGVAAATLILLVGFMLIIRGVFDAVMAFSDDSATGKTLSIVAGIVAVLAGVVVLTQPAAAGVAFVWILGVFALVTGPVLIAMSLDVKREMHELQNGNGKKARARS
jgi:uncharacterized membrane protein HdeD (DUF308 family)